MTENENYTNNPQDENNAQGTPEVPTPPVPQESNTPEPPPQRSPYYTAPPEPPRDDNRTYTWQNPNPYNGGYSGQSEPATKPATPPKKRMSFAEIALIVVGGISILLLIVVISLVMSKSPNPPTNDDSTQNGDVTQDEGGDKSENKNDTSKVERPTENLPTLETQKPSTEVLTIPQIYNKVKDSVVGITVNIKQGGAEGQGSGTGIILSEDGYISTNAHVVDGADKITVILTDESEHEAQLIGIDTKTDLAVLKIKKDGLQPAEFGDSDSLVVGETVVAIGNPYGIELAGTVTSGIVSALNRQIVIESFYMTLIQTDASINPGNSGGPLVNSYGQVIGITSSKIVSSGYEGIGFAIPMSGATDIIQDLIQYGYIKDRPYIGITGFDVTEADAQMYSIPQGVRVYSVDPESDASKQGVKRDDIIIAVNDVEVKSMAELDAEKNKCKPGDEITLKIYRNGKKLDIKIKLSESTAQ